MDRRIPSLRRQPERLVFSDDTSVKTNLTRLRGRARRGQRLRMDAPFGGWGTQTFLAGLTSEGLIAPWVIKGAMDGSAFATYVPRRPGPGTDARLGRHPRQPRHSSQRRGHSRHP
ncbi:hypothetical protein E4L95_20245 [Paracoccus liaowanqingii]|uniref:Tc1-like transposase DDE domain-containing protein n=1 Tax=Paracoccus liaowanqingii TaxID=2560053 RepID=A0A4Z1CJZ7_9RHOB|nr:hypothetical protein E4L95_20245 [Paracoccus liaowanqingii]